MSWPWLITILILPSTWHKLAVSIYSSFLQYALWVLNFSKPSFLIICPRNFKVDSFCYLGNMIGIAGSCVSSKITKSHTACRKFRELLPIFKKTCYPTCQTWGNVGSSCVHSFLTYTNEFWAICAEVNLHLVWNYCFIIGWICDVKCADRISIVSLYEYLDISPLDLTLIIWRFGYMAEDRQ